MYKVEVCSHNDLDAAWPVAELFLEKFKAKVSDNLTGIDEFKNKIYGCKSQLWMIFDLSSCHAVEGIVLTEVHEHEGGKSLVITVCCGENMKDWLQLIEDILAWGREQGCIQVEIHGRKGWSDFIAAYGFRHKYNIYTSQL